MTNCYSILGAQSFTLSRCFAALKERSWYDGTCGTIGQESFAQSGRELRHPKGGLVGHMDRARPDRGCGGPVRERRQYQMDCGGAPEMESLAGRCRAAAGSRRAIRGAVCTLVGIVRDRRGGPRVPPGTVRGVVPVRLRRSDGTVFFGSMGSGVTLQSRAAPGGVGFGFADLEHSWRAQMGRGGTAR